MVALCAAIDFDLRQSNGARNGARSCDQQGFNLQGSEGELVRSANPIDHIQSALGRQAKLCDLLEHIADGLPENVDPAVCAAARQMLVMELPLHHRDQEEGLFPLLAKRAVPGDNVEQQLRQLSLEHATDEGVASELLELLPVLAGGRQYFGPNATGYLLRNFFECYRRHLAWEQIVIIPLARRRLSAPDLEALAGRIADHRR